MLRHAKVLGMAVVSLAALSGCQTSRKSPYADNPLLLSREPLLQSSGQGNSRSVVVSNPQKPQTSNPKQPLLQTSRGNTNPASAVTAMPMPQGPTIGTADQLLTTRPTAANAIVVPPPITPQSSEKVPEPVLTPPAAAPSLPTPPAPRTASDAIMPVSYQRLSNAPDHSWLQGEFDVHYRGYKELRFRSASEDDSIGGKVRLVDDPRLNEFKPGDVIRVDGDLVKEDLNLRGNQYPRYLIRSVQLVERKSER